MRAALPLTLLGAVVLVAGIGLHPVGRDEAVSLLLVRHPATQVVSMLTAHEVQPAGYFLLLWAWPHSTLVDGRLLSALAAVACVPVTLVAGARLGARRAWLVGLLLATSPFLAYEAQQARMYAWLALFGATALLAVASLPEHPGRRWAAALGALMAAGLYLHYYAAFTDLGVMLLLLWRRRFATAALAAGVAGLLFLPGLWMLYHQLPVFARYPDDAWQERLTPRGMLNVSGLLFGGAEYDPYGRATSLLLSVPAVAGLWFAPRRVRVLVACGAGLPLLVGLASPTFSPRYLAAAAPALLLCLAIAIDRLPGRVAWAGTACATAVSLMLVAYTDVRYDTLQPPTPELLAAARSAGAVYVVGHVTFATQAAYYAPGQEVFAFPPPKVDHVGLWAAPPGLPYPPGLDDPARRDQPVLAVDYCNFAPPVPPGYVVTRRWVDDGADFCAWLASPPSAYAVGFSKAPTTGASSNSDS